MRRPFVLSHVKVEFAVFSPRGAEKGNPMALVHFSFNSTLHEYRRVRWLGLVINTWLKS